MNISGLLGHRQQAFSFALRTQRTDHLGEANRRSGDVRCRVRQIYTAGHINIPASAAAAPVLCSRLAWRNLSSAGRRYHRVTATISKLNDSGRPRAGENG